MQNGANDSLVSPSLLHLTGSPESPTPQTPPTVFYDIEQIPKDNLSLENKLNNLPPRDLNVLSTLHSHSGKKFSSSLNVNKRFLAIAQPNTTPTSNPSLSNRPSTNSSTSGLLYSNSQGDLISHPPHRILDFSLEKSPVQRYIHIMWHNRDTRRGDVHHLLRSLVLLETSHRKVRRRKALKPILAIDRQISRLRRIQLTLLKSP